MIITGSFIMHRYSKLGGANLPPKLAVGPPRERCICRLCTGDLAEVNNFFFQKKELVFLLFMLLVFPGHTIDCEVYI
jgi:hypothetical protein